MKEIGKRLNNAIVDKVKKVLDNMDSPRSVDMNIRASLGEIPTIQYHIEENITWGDEKPNE